MFVLKKGATKHTRFHLYHAGYLLPAECLKTTLSLDSFHVVKLMCLQSGLIAKAHSHLQGNNSNIHT